MKPYLNIIYDFFGFFWIRHGKFDILDIFFNLGCNQDFFIFFFIDVQFSDELISYSFKDLLVLSVRKKFIHSSN